MTISAATIRAALEDGTIEPDGHTIFSPEKYMPHFTMEQLSGLLMTYQSDFSSHKSTIYTQDGPVESLQGIYNLHFLMWLRDELGIRGYATAGGRGFAAQQYVNMIWEWLDEQPV